jgi:hypothetical protein
LDTKLRELFNGILDNPDDEHIEEFSVTAAASDGRTSHATGALVASEFYLAKTLRAALVAHADALNASAEASEKNAKSLTRATWALTAATIVMAIATVIIAYIGYLQINSPT